MSKIKGQNFRLLVGSAVVPEATNCSITLTGNTEDTSTKDTDGFYSKDTVVSTSWQAQVDSYDADPTTLTSLVSTFNAGQPVAVGWDQTSGTGNATTASANFSRSGNAILNDLTFTFNDRQTCSVSSQYQGTGPLT